MKLRLAEKILRSVGHRHKDSTVREAHYRFQLNQWRSRGNKERLKVHPERIPLAWCRHGRGRA